MSEPAVGRASSVLLGIVEAARTLLPEQWQGFSIGGRANLVQMYFEPNELGRKVHFEVWQRRGYLEVGLHFEAEAGANEFLFSSFQQRQPAIDAALNVEASQPLVRVARWDKGWARVHCEMPTQGVRAVAREANAVAHRLAAMIATLQPMYDEIMS